MQNIAFWGNKFQPDHLAAINNLLTLLKNEKVGVYIEKSFADYLTENGINLESRDINITTSIPDNTKIVLSFGGDGTLLRAAEWVGRREIPIMGVNTGHLGYLTSYTLDDTYRIIQDSIYSKGRLECLSLIEVSGFEIPEEIWPYALNEVALLKSETSSMLKVRANIDNHYLADYQADGLIVATPTGSTAYNLSVGGPIMQPTLPCWAISPIAPHSLTMRPLVVSAESQIELRAESRSNNYRLSLDGRSFLLQCSDSAIEIRKADFSIIVMRSRGEDFASILRSKLNWGC